MWIFEKLHLPGLLNRVDTTTMAASVEARVPFVDHELVEFALGIPNKYKLKWKSNIHKHIGGILNSDQISEKYDTPKYILKKAVEPYLPEEVIYRKKMGFGVPIDHWFRHELKELTYDTLLSQRALERGYFNRDYIQSLLDRHQKGETWQYLIWNLLMLEMWHLMFVDKTLSRPGST